jgi:hypothetical protein
VDEATDNRLMDAMTMDTGRTIYRRYRRTARGMIMLAVRIAGELAVLCGVTAAFSNTPCGLLLIALGAADIGIVWHSDGKAIAAFAARHTGPGDN